MSARKQRGGSSSPLLDAKRLGDEVAYKIASPGGAADPPCDVSRSDLTERSDEVDRQVCQPRVDRECALCHRGAEPRSGGGQHFSQAAPIARESRRAAGILTHVHRLCAAVLPHLYHSVGIADRNPARLRPAIGGQRIDRAALKWRECYARLRSAGCDRA